MLTVLVVFLVVQAFNFISKIKKGIIVWDVKPVSTNVIIVLLTLDIFLLLNIQVLAFYPLISEGVEPTFTPYLLFDYILGIILSIFTILYFRSYSKYLFYKIAFAYFVISTLGAILSNVSLKNVFYVAFISILWYTFFKSDNKEEKKVKLKRMLPAVSRILYYISLILLVYLIIVLASVILFLEQTG